MDKLADREARTSRRPDARLSRRAVVGGICAGLALPGRRAFAAGMISPVMATLSTYMSEAGERALPPEVIEAAKHHILDTFAAMISGSTLPPATFAYGFARTLGKDTAATIVASAMTADPMDAALINGLLAHSDETDDSNEFAQTHPGCAIVPAAFAAAEKFGIDGAHFLRAVTLGYDIGPRMTMSFGAIDYRNNSHKSTHAIANVFGAAAAAGCAAHLNAQQMRWMLDLTAQQSAGIGAWTRDTAHIEKGFVFAGMPARNGVTAALMVAGGESGIDDIFSGADNYFLAYAPNADQSKLVDQLGVRYEIARTNIKKWTVGSPIQAPLDAMANILRKRPVKPDDVRAIVVRTASTEARIVDNRDLPDICLQHLVAVMLVDGTVTFQAAHDTARMKDPTILKARAKVQLVSSEELERLEPARAAIVEITLNDGAVLTNRVNAVRGTADNPMTRDEVIEKCQQLVEPVIGVAKCKALIDQVMGLERVTDIRALRVPLQTS